MKLTLTVECDGKTRSMDVLWRNFKPTYRDWVDDLLFDLSGCASVWKEFWRTKGTRRQSAKAERGRSRAKKASRHRAV